MGIDEVITKLRAECPTALVNQCWDGEKWHVMIYRVGGSDGALGLRNYITPELLPRITDKSIRRMGKLINGLL